MGWSEWGPVMTLRRRSAPVDVAARVADGFGRHLTGRNAAVLAYFGVLTLFPLLMAATTVLGYVLEGRPDLQASIVDSALAQIPVFGGSIRESAGDIDGNWIALTVGLAAATWSSMKAFLATQTAFDDIWEIPVAARANPVVRRGRALIGIGVIGAAQIGNVVLAGVVAEAGLPRLGQAALTAGGLAINVGVLAAMFRFLTERKPSWSEVWPGALLGGIVYTVLQYAGTAIVTRTLNSARGVYGDFAGLLALMSWISTHALVALVGAELNAAVAERRRERTEAGHGAPDPAPSEPPAAGTPATH